MKHYKAEIWDKIQKGFEAFNDHCLHGVIRFEGFLDMEALRKAIWQTSILVPIIRCRFVTDEKHARWEEMDQCTTDDLFSIIEVHLSGLEAEKRIESIMTQKIDETTGPQLSVTLLRNNGHGDDTLSVMLNHMVCDGAGFKQFLYLLCHQYNLAMSGEKDTKDYAYLLQRSDRQVYADLTIKDYRKVITAPFYLEKQSPMIRIPFGNECQPMHPHILIRTVSEEELKHLVAFAKTNCCTLNDLFMAAVYRTIDHELEISGSLPVILSCPIDLRRYIKDKQHIGLCNLSSSVWCNIGLDLGNDMIETTQKVRDAMGRIKKNYPGLKNFYFLNALMRWYPYAAFEKRIKTSFPNPLIGITNTGILDSKELLFNGVRIRNAFINGSIKYPPYFQIAFSTYESELTISINQYCADMDLPKIESFLSFFKTQLLSATASLDRD
ncbi:hypothetical protein [Microbacter margulisiae]|uniref:NRPS condensation-like uncharacterized protein n=1 Tax=Microbacter margulisiae TaxID=1350067 RepID=A0A7W5DP26_9PORP|nr:hypothetical protein [Microbacter margulisiae]MBB3186113.1 NRPS condensation-like uncharacterized protein [Microbacter margulisiae]